MAPEKPSRRKHKTEPPPLSAKAIRFCQLVVTDDLSFYEAYLQAGFPARPTRDATDKAVGRLVRKHPIREYIRHLQRSAADTARATVEEVAQGFRRGANADVAGMIGPDGMVLPPNEWPDELRLAVTRVEVDDLHEWVDDPDTGKRTKVKTGQRWKVWLENKTECRKVLAQWLRMVGPEKAADAAAPAPLVIGGEASPAALLPPAAP